MKYALTSVPGLADVGVTHGDGDGPRTQRVSDDLLYYIPNNSCSMKYALKLVPGLADVGVLHGDGDGPRTPPRCLERSGKSFK